MIGFASALVVSVIIHALVLGAIWVDQSAQARSGAQSTAIFIPSPRMGQSNGQGTAANSSAGDEPLEARQSIQTQAALGRQPTGASISHAMAAPSMQASAPQPIGQVLPGEQAISTTAKVYSMPPLKWPHLAAASPPVSGGQSTQTPAGDPYQQSESESDPFSNAEHVVMRNGRVDPRFGRKVKTTRPDFGDEAEQALMDHVQLSVVLKVNTDRSGKVMSVDVLRSSGSVAVDLAMKLAMYNWWIEPPKSKNGQPKSDVMVWKITFE